MSTQYDPNRYEPERGTAVNDDARAAELRAAELRATDQRSVGELVGDMVGQLSQLFRKEIQLARAEMSEKVSYAAGGIPGIAGGAALGFGALILLLFAAAAGVTRLTGLAPGWGMLIIGLIAGIGGYLLIRGGLSQIKNTDLTPHRTAEQLSRDAQAAKEQVK